jgi:hypothetical protein
VVLHGVLHSAKDANHLYICLSSEKGLSLQDRQFGQDPNINSLLETSNKYQLLHGALHSARSANCLWICLSSKGGLPLQDGALVEITPS